MNSSTKPSSITVSLCITCMGRLFHLRETLLENIRKNLSSGSFEIVLLDYSSNDGLDAWVRQSLREFIEMGICNYYQLFGQTRFHIAHAKNVAHRVATGQIVCNVDADMMLREGFVDLLRTIFGNAEHVIVRPDVNNGGTAGLIACARRDFEALRGYDEELINYGYDDDDLFARAVEAGLKPSFIPHESGLFEAIQHTEVVRCANYDIKDKRLACRLNKELSLLRKARGIRTVNKKGFGRAHLVKNFVTDLILE